MDKFETLARSAYDAYGEVTDHKNYQGLPMPQFDDLSETIQRAWIAAAKRVSIDEYKNTSTPESWLSTFDTRQQKEIEFARLYAANFNHGTTGHNQLVIIALLADLLDKRQGE